MVTFGLGSTKILDGGQLEARESVRETVSTGFQLLDTMLPGRGVRRGSLVEWLAGRPGSSCATAGTGAASLACAVACHVAGAAERPGTIVVVDRTGWFHPPAMLPWLDSGTGPARLVVARPAHDDDEIWTIDQALRCAGVAAVLAWPREGMGATLPGSAAARRRPSRSWTIAMRRWQLAARSSGAVGLLVRPASMAGEPSWAEARIAVSPMPGGGLLERRLHLVRTDGGWGAGTNGVERSVEIVLDLARGCRGTTRPAHAPAGARAFDGRRASCRAS